MRYSPRGQTPEQRLRQYGWTITTKGCWEWLGNVDKRGYGHVVCRGKNCLTHRLAYESWVGDPMGRIVRHSCDNPPCLNPEHLLLGSLGDNNRDRVMRQRSYSKLTESDVLEVRALYAAGYFTQAQLGKTYGVTPSMVSNIITRRNWRHLDG